MARGGCYDDDYGDVSKDSMHGGRGWGVRGSRYDDDDVCVCGEVVMTQYDDDDGVSQDQYVPGWSVTRCPGTVCSVTPSTLPPGWSPTACVSSSTSLSVCLSVFVSRFGLAVKRLRLVSGRTSVRYRFGSPFSSKRLWFVDTVTSCDFVHHFLLKH